MNFTGAFILRGSTNKEGNDRVDWLWRYIVRQDTAAFTIGNVKHTQHSMFEISGDTAVSEMLFKMVSDFRFESYAYTAWGTAPLHTLIPQRNSSITVWSSTNDESCARICTTNLLQLNQEPWGEDTSNYGKRVAARVFSQLPPIPRSVSMVYAGPAPGSTSFILSSHLKRINMWLVYVQGNYMIVWSTLDNLFEPVFDSEEKNHLLTVPIELPPSMVVALQPLHLVHKFHKYIKNYGPGPDKYMYVMQYISNRIRNSVIAGG